MKGLEWDLDKPDKRLESLCQSTNIPFLALEPLFRIETVERGRRPHFRYNNHWGFGVINLIEMQDGDVVTVNGTRIRPFRVAEDYVYAFLFDDDEHCVLIAPDELFGWSPPPDV